jgi:2-oxoglutarate dehydrogenase complex dehydrogenase (E1) component-like enzyme
MTRSTNSSSSIKQVWHFLFGSMRKNRRTVARSTPGKNRATVVEAVSSNQVASVNLLRDFIFDGYVTSYDSLREQAPVQQALAAEKVSVPKPKPEHKLSSADYLSLCENTYCCTIG